RLCETRNARVQNIRTLRFAPAFAKASVRQAAKGLRSLSQRDHFPQHSQAVVEKTDLASCGMIPADRDFTNAQSGAMRQKKQLDIERETISLRRLQNRPANVEAKRLKTALGVPKRQAGCGPHKKVENTAPLLSPPGLVNPN